MRLMVMMAAVVALIGWSLVFRAACADSSDVNAPDATQPAEDSTPIVEAIYTPEPIEVDGVLDEPIWERAAVYSLHLGDDRAKGGEVVQEPGEVRFAWDEDCFYLAVSFTDSDIVAEGEEDQLQHFKLGDLCELFLKPVGKTWYWELYVTPVGRKTAYWFPGPGRVGLPSNEEYDSDLEVEAQVDGTLNHWADRDERWTAEMSMPVRELTRGGVGFGPESDDWRILIGRYNYGRYLDRLGPELSMTPKLSKTNYHLHAEYARLKLVKEAAEH